MEARDGVFMKGPAKVKNERAATKVDYLKE